MSNDALSLVVAKDILSRIEEIETLSDNGAGLLTLLPEVYKDYDENTITNFLLRMRFDNKHYYDFIKNKLSNIPEFAPFDIDIDFYEKIVLSNKKPDYVSYSECHKVITIDFVNKSYCLDPLNRLCEKYEEILKDKPKRKSRFDNRDYLMEEVGKYLKHPSFINKIHLSLFGFDKNVFSESLSTFFTNMTTSDETFEISYSYYTRGLKNKQCNDEFEVQKKKNINTWYYRDFPTIINNCNLLASYLDSLGYVETKRKLIFV